MVVERTFSWIDTEQEDEQRLREADDTSEAFVYVAMTRLMARRLARS
jgi:hypothetical protein